ncbi:hypothetical protein Sjap_011433 [Stephania japonica]|uniref:BHLH domain-containing protein n=1 Tax=Stephania japonica TaxID=461633 RepID=A0AAP0P833_9MAGN
MASDEIYSSDEDGLESSSSTNPGGGQTETISQQLQMLQSLVPNITNTRDERTILEATHDYLGRIHEETERIQKELSSMQPSSSTNNPESLPRRTHESGSATQRSQITNVEVEEHWEGRFIVKVTWRREYAGAAGNVQRVIERLDAKIKMVSIAVEESADPTLMLTTAFIKVMDCSYVFFADRGKISQQQIH